MTTLTLTILRGPQGSGSARRQIDHGEWAIGRGSDCHWSLDDPQKSLSRRHCLIRQTADGWEVYDLSTNGTFLNGASVPVGRDQVQPLRDGDRLRVGDYELEARVAGAAWTTPPPAAPIRPFGADAVSAFPPASPGGSGAGGGAFGGGGGAGPVGGGVIPDDWDRSILLQRGGGSPLGAAFPALGAQPVAAPPAAESIPPLVPAAPAARIPDDFLPAAGLPEYRAQPVLIPDDFHPFAVPAPSTDSAAGAGSAAAATNVVPAAIPGQPVLAGLAAAGVSAGIPVPAPVPAAPAPAAMAASPAAASGATAASAVAPASAGSPPAVALQALLAGAGLPPETADRLGADPEQALRAAGALLRAAVTGMRSLLTARSEVKREFRIEQTLVHTKASNALKFAPSDALALMALLDPQQDGLNAVASAFEDLTEHELAVLAATQSAARHMLESLDPARLEAESGGRSGLFGESAEKRLWNAYRRHHAKLIAAFEDDFESVFGVAFARAYERAIGKGKD